MDNQYFISFVVCLNEHDETVQDEYRMISLAESNPQVQLVVVYDDNCIDIKDSIFADIKGDNIAFINASASDDLSAELKASVKGKYVSFSRIEVSISDKDIRTLISYMNKEDDIVIARISLDEKFNRFIREHNNYCDRFDKGTNLSDNVYMLHNMSFGYFFKTKSLVWLNGISSDNWAYDIIRLTYANAVMLPDMGYAKGVDVHFTSGTLAMTSWNDAFSDEESVRNIFNRLIVRLNEIRQNDKVIYNVNADYALLYYVVRLAESINNIEDMEETLLESLSAFIDDFLRSLSTKDIIVSNRHINRTNKHFILNKYFDVMEGDGSEELDVIFEPSHYKTSMIYFEEKNGILHLEYTVEQPEEKEYDICIRIDGKVKKPVSVCDYKEMHWAGLVSSKTKIYGFDVALKDIKKTISICISSEKGIERLVETTYGKYTPFSTKVDLYKKINDRLMFVTEERATIRVVEVTKRNETALIYRRNKSFVKKGIPGMKAIAARKLFEQKKEKQEKNIWLFSDRTNRGDDNGEVLFQYICENPIDGVEPYFVIDKDTDDWNRMQEFGKVVAPFSREHKMLFLLSEYSLSSQANAAVVNPFGKYEYLYRDLMYDKRLIFLQHGITKDNQSKWLNKYNRNLYGFIVTTKPEYDSVFEYDYYYTPDRVWLTGMPRYDKLYHDEKKYITVMPTWRKSLSAGTDEKGVWILGDEFKDSEYFRFYNDLLNSRRLIQAADKYGYKICFMPHPNTIAGIDMFEHNPKVEFMDMSFSYRDVFAQTDLMITDYSSVAFDFAYLRKPIVYSQFDKESFFSGEHSYTEGYFDYERDGFGEVENNLDSVIDRVIEYMKTGCKLKPLYEERINKTFAFNDHDCCRRVMECAMKYR
ncbi:MAG: CDP-glycerol glycerophosphotransferase family protein [Coprococcus sp.]